MKIDKIMKAYYASKLDGISDATPAFDLPEMAEKTGAVGWEDVLGALVTAGYLIQMLLPGNWFSFGRFFFIFNFGF